MTRVLNKVFSMSIMSLFLLAFFGAIAVATFVENDFGTPVAQKWIYKMWWFEGIILYLFFTLCYNIYRYKLIQTKKIGSLVFHSSFLIIVIGAACTRYLGFEGAMTIREGASSNVIISYDTFVQMKVHDFEQQYVNKMPVIMDGYTDNYFEHSFEFPESNEPISIEFVRLQEYVKDTFVIQGASKGQPYMDIFTAGESNYLKSGNVLTGEGIKFAFNNTAYTDAVSIFSTDSGVYIQSPYEISYVDMSGLSIADRQNPNLVIADSLKGALTIDSLQKFPLNRLYTCLGLQFVPKYYPSASVEMISNPITGTKEAKAVTVKVSNGGTSKEVVLRGGRGRTPVFEKFELNGLNYELAFGSKLVELPFFIFLDDFEMARYPGTENPSSFSSYVTLVDPEKGIEKEHHIFMNNVLDYGGYRFFQSNYDPDELGSVLSVNQDAIGTNITYLGYFLLGLGFIITLFSKSARFRFLMKKADETRSKREGLGMLMLVLGLFVGGQGFSQEIAIEDTLTKDGAFFNFEGGVGVVDAVHAEKFGRLVIQNQRGRFQPVHTLATDILKKVHRSATYNDQSAMQVFIGFHTDALAWNMEPIIYVSGKGIRNKLNIEGKYASFFDFLSLEFQYLLAEDAAIARNKKPSERNQYDKDVLKTDERFNILSGVFSGMYLKIMPLPNDIKENWYSPFDSSNPFEGEDADFLNTIIPLYQQSIIKAQETGDWGQADQVVGLIDLFQRRVANAASIPSKSKIGLEIFYNNFDIFKRLMNYYLIIGFLLLIVLFVQLFRPKIKVNWAINIGFVAFLLMATAHGIGLGLRWYLSGHAPWSNGYEAVVFIAFIAAIAGLLFYKQSKIVLGATGILVWLMLFVAHMNALDPEITQLVPVLQSYWLMIHVAIITGSYAFLGLGAILGLICLVINLFINPRNKKRLLLTTKELTYVSEMTIMIGLFMLTIGTFLGGVWANESWGRYWGWDAKETWALASVLVYSMILHFRFVPGLKSQLAFNIASLWGYGSIIMTFFGVNFYLSGLHSYAQGDPIPIPSWVPITTMILLLLTVSSGIVLRLAKKNMKPDED